MTARTLVGAGYRVLGQAKLTIASPATTQLDFGTPDDLKLVIGTTGTTLRTNDRLLLVCSATTAGTTSTLTWVVQDAPDNAGSIGTPATAITDATGGTLAGSTGDDTRVIGVQLQTDRPWIRVLVTHATATDSFVCTCTAIAVPAGLC
jgi:hypothetical protein